MLVLLKVMTIKAKLTVRLLADTVLVAESNDEDLWKRVLSAIHGGTSGGEFVVGEHPNKVITPPSLQSPLAEKSGGVKALAKEIEVVESEVDGALSPTHEAPFITLDVKLWETFKKANPPRGRNAISPIVLSGTILCLWFKCAGIEGRPTQKQAQDVLHEIGERDKNPSRAVKNCEWLQSRGDGLQLNPARYSKAINLAKAFVLGKAYQDAT
jgi:hypothetical protein